MYNILFMTQRTKFKITIYLILLIILVSMLIWWMIYNSGRSRDFERLADMKIIEAEMNNYYLKFNTYKIADCPNDTAINFCVGKDSKVLEVSNIIDPLSQLNFQYVVRSLTDDDFQIDFAFEVGVGGLLPGNYSLTKQGINK